MCNEEKFNEKNLNKLLEKSVWSGGPFDMVSVFGFWLVDLQVMPFHDTDHMSQRSQVSGLVVSFLFFLTMSATQLLGDKVTKKAVCG